MPVLAVQPVDNGRTAIFCGDTTRNWQQGPRAQGQDSPFLQFWGQMVRWLSGRSEAVEPGASIAGETDKAYYEPEEPVRISAIVRDQEGEGATGVDVIAKIRGPEGRPDQVKLGVVPGPAGHYDGEFHPESAGSYQIVVETKVGDKTLATEEMMVEVGRPNMEFEKLDLDEKTLGRISSETGGRYVHISAADYLIEHFDRTQQKKHVSITFPHYDWPLLLPCWLAFVAALSTEWVLRKRFQLR